MDWPQVLAFGSDVDGERERKGEKREERALLGKEVLGKRAEERERESNSDR